MPRCSHPSRLRGRSSALLPAVVGLLLLPPGCGGGDSAPSPARPESVKPTSGLVSPQGCGVGERPSLDASGAAGPCAAVGARSVPEGFRLGQTGVEAIRPEDRCTGATLALLGARQCTPVDEGCDGPFPPPEASVVVRPAGGSSQGPMPPGVQVVASLDEALRVAGSGATIALDEGTYTPVTLDRSLRLVGRCAARVVFADPRQPQGIGVEKKMSSSPLAVDVELRSLTIRGFRAGMAVNRRATAHLEGVVFEGNRGALYVGNEAKVTVRRSAFQGPLETAALRDTSGIFASYGATVELDEVDVRDLQSAVVTQDAGTTLRLRRSIVAFERTPVDASATFSAVLGANLQIEESYLEATRARLGMVSRFIPSGPPPADANAPPSQVSITRSTLVHAGIPREASSVIDVQGGSRLDLEQVTLRHQSYIAIDSFEEGVVTARASTFAASDEGMFRTALAASGGRVRLEDVWILGSRQMALFADRRGHLEVLRSLVEGTVETDEVVGMFPGVGAQGQAIAVGNDGIAEIRESALVGNDGTAVFAVEGGQAVVEGSLIDGAARTRTGAGVLNGALALEGSIIRNLAEGVAVQSGRAVVRASTLHDNGAAFAVGGLIRFVEEDLPLEVTPEGALVTFGNVFRNNGELRRVDR